jgi:hypothetical protein
MVTWGKNGNMRIHIIRMFLLSIKLMLNNPPA